MDKELLFWVWLLILAGLAEGYSWPRSQNPRSQRSRSGKSQKPNIVVIMTDDQDELLDHRRVKNSEPISTKYNYVYILNLPSIHC
uniref:Uncharacterized protein n=1 Tax=Magallana gigas TaxID=29159 RepID=K1Q964_MAGGI